VVADSGRDVALRLAGAAREEKTDDASLQAALQLAAREGRKAE
jgi:hypothetical protein